MNVGRREFLLAGAMAAAGCAGGRAVRCGAGAGCGAVKKEGGRILFGACLSSPEDVALMKSVGYDFWEWSAGEAFDPSKDGEWWKRQKEKILSRALPLRSCNGFLPGRFRLTGPAADHAPALAYAETVLRRADEAGLVSVVFGSGGARNVPGDVTAKNPADRPDPERGAEQYAEFCRELARRVSDLGKVAVVVEPLRPRESNIINFVWQGRQIVEDVASERVKLLADIFHMMMGREDADSIVKAGSLLRHCHIADWKTRKFPGADPAQTWRLAPYFAALAKIGYTGGVSCECGWGSKENRAKDLETALKTMKGLA